MKKNKTNAFDWTLIQWARSCDEEKLVDASNIDRELELERDAQGRLVDSESCFSERARRLLDSMGISGKRQYERAISIKLFSCFVVVALGALVFPMARVERLLGDEVNLAGPFFFFVVGQIFFLSASLILSCALALQAFARRLSGKTRPKTFGEKLVESLSNVVGEIVLFVLRKQISLARSLQKERPLEALFSRRRNAQGTTARNDSVEDSLELKGRALFWDVIFSRPRFLFFWGGTLSQLFWTSCSFCVLIILGARMQSERYDYRWITSLESQRVVMNVVKGLEPSVAWLGIEPLTKSDVESLFEENSFLAAPPANEKSTLSDAEEQEETGKESVRMRWSYFLLGVVFVWCVLPRAFLCAVNYSFYKFSLRDFRPKLDDPYFKKIRENLELRSSRIESQYVKDENDSFEDSSNSTSLPQATPENITVYEEIVAKSNLQPTPIIERDVPKEEHVVETTPSNVVPVPESRDISTVEVDAPTLEEIADPNLEIPSSEPKNARSLENKPPLQVKIIKEEKVSIDFKPETPSIQESVNESKAPTFAQSVATATRAILPSPAKCASVSLALGYDASLSDDQWRDLLPTRSETAILGDVADDPANKKRLRALLQERGASISLCVFVTDVSFPPARHLTRFLRDSLIPGAPDAQFFVVLSGGERLRKKFDANTTAVSERLADWKRTLEALAAETGAKITPTFFYDADLDLPEQRTKLRDLLRGNASSSKTQINETKQNAAAETIYQECLAIFESNEYAPSEEESRLRVSNLCSRIFEIYRSEVDQASSCGVRKLESGDSGGSILTRLSSVASKMGGETLVRGGTALSDALAAASLEKGLDIHSVEKGLSFACGLSVRAKELCRKLSPKCAIALGSVGLAAPVAVALAPVLGGTLSLSAIAASVTALSSALPSTLVGGALGGALGALTPLSLSACKKKLLEKLSGGRSKPEKIDSNDARSVDQDETSTSYALEKIADVGTLLCSAASWFVVLDLQRTSEDEIVELLPVVLEPVETSTFETPKEVRKALDAVVENLQNI